MTRIFKPEGKKGENNLSDGSKSESIPSRFLKKSQNEPEVDKRKEYLKTLEANIFSKSKEWEALQTKIDFDKTNLERSFERVKTERETELATLENSLVLKREERRRLEQPLEEREKILDERKQQFDQRDVILEGREQQVFEREHEAELKIESAKDMVDKLGETQVFLLRKETALNARDNALSQRETMYLVQVDQLNDEKRRLKVEMEKRETDVSFRELNLRGKETNIIQREDLLIADRDLHEKVEEKRKGIEARDAQLKIQEEESLKVQYKNTEMTSFLEKREGAVMFREFQVQSKEENLIKREEKLIQDKLLVDSKRQALLAAKKT